MSFSYPCYRRLVKYLGEADAMVEVMELAVRHFISEAKCETRDFVGLEASKHGIRVSLNELDRVQVHLARHYIVMVYESAERFLKEFRREHFKLHGLKWSGDAEDKNRLTVTLENVVGTIDQDIVDRFQYYRLVRNWIVHNQEGDAKEAMMQFDAIVPYSEQNSAVFGTTPGPNRPEMLTFDDFILFSRITKHLGGMLCEAGKLPVERWSGKVDLKKFQRLKKNKQRMRNAIIGRLRTEYGMDEEMAGEITCQLEDSLA